jgi:hypothetical protein
MNAVTATLALLLASGPGLGRADGTGEGATPTPSNVAPRPRLTLNLPAQAAATGGILLLGGFSQLEAKRLAAPACRWCEQPQVDRWARRELRWNDVKTAGAISDVLVFAIPVGAAVTLGLSARADGAGRREVSEDLLMVTEAASLAVLLTQASKLAAGRVRPDAWARGGRTTADDRMAFWGGHSAFAFSVAAGATQVARLRGRAGWKWLAVASFAGAAATGWLRVSADRHWLTDVVVGAGVGTAVGLAVPLLVLRPATERTTAVMLVPAPGGLALLF